ncbi:MULTISPECIES: hypothetical protein [Hyphomicrobiales]|jgi:hypothetical protein|uniref:hypothetical protein n=1 Tax=Hyphomicrobiales TaxID=356 RepID=UPI0010F6A4BD|nr:MULTISPECIES: hypothetical protein [Mesorhizobium]MBA3038671.1 hypothetical protein [Rhizobiaceae bacterium]MBN8949178.1 hypothetical protein [Rhizobium tropici]MBN8993629.1 hypothetical protein [Hyphomicrobiales bacterium]MBN9134531.1 hypothetical protein [Phyllobacterium sp.]MBN9217128.1 hypothetical protein [Mesorhizobium sp.]
MQAETFYFDDASSVDFDKTTAIEVIADIAYVNSDFFARDLAVQDDPRGPTGEGAALLVPHAGLRTIRLAKGGEKLSRADIGAWDDLVNNHLLPFLDRQIADLEAEKSATPEFEQPYALLAASIRSKREATARQHKAFMSGFDIASKSRQR